jgi:acetolactate synthase I/II/III large subunit
MADAAAKLTGKPGVCIVTRGPGASNALIGLHTAFQDSTPVVLLVGQVASDQRDREAFQELDYRQFFGPGTLGMAKWVGEIHSPDRLLEYVARAFHIAQQGRPGPVVLALPEDMLRAPTSAAVQPRAEVVHAWPAPGALRQLRDWLAQAKRPLVLLGGSGWTAASGAALQRFAEHWQLPVACAFRFQDCFDNRHPQYVGDVGIGINPALARMVAASDLLLVVGARLGEMTTQGYTAPPLEVRAGNPQRLVHIHAGPEELGRVYPADLLVQSSMAVIGKALEGLAAPVSVAWQDWLAQGQAHHALNRSSSPEAPLDLAQVVLTLERLLPQDTIYTNGAGNHTGWLHRYMRYGAAHAVGRTQLAPTAGAMGYGLPAAVAASLLAPDRHVVNFAGDG